LAFLNVLRENTVVFEAQRLFSNLRAKVMVTPTRRPNTPMSARAGHDGGDFVLVPQ
jgi:hypothetical protein